MKKFVLRLDLQEDQEEKRRALKTVSTLKGIDELTIDMKGKTLTVIGTVDPISVVSKLRKKKWCVGIITLGPVEEPEKKSEEEEVVKKDEPVEQEPKNEEEPKTEEEKKAEEPVNDEDEKSEAELMVGRLMQYKQYYPPMNRYISVHHSIEEDPNACVIC